MARIKVYFALKDEDWERYQGLVERFPDKVKKATDEYMHKDVKELMIKEITGEMPRSDRNKANYKNPRHAKDSIWYVSFNFDQAVTVETKVSGGKRNSFYYLFFPHEGTVKITKPNPFAERVVNREYNRIVTGLFNVIDREIKEELI